MDEQAIQLMLIDDDFDLRDSLTGYFQSRGLSVRAFASGIEFLAELPNKFNGVVICDLQMPEMNGLEVLRSLNALEDAPPFILLTAYGDIPTAVEAMNLGAYDFLEKPFEPQLLREKVIQAAKTRKQQIITPNFNQQKKLREYVENFEKSLLEQALTECQGHIGKVCELLNVPRRTLNEKLIKHNIHRHDYLP